MTLETEQSIDTWPPEVDLILSALEAGNRHPHDRRRGGRFDYRVCARLRLFSDTQFAPPWMLYTRDANTRCVGFLTPHRLPLGYGGTVELPAPNGACVIAHCTLLRCREAAPGWFEGALYFNREQAPFETK